MQAEPWREDRQAVGGVGGRNSSLYEIVLTIKAFQNIAGSIHASNLHAFPLQTLHRIILITKTGVPAPQNKSFSNLSPNALLKFKKKTKPKQKTEARKPQSLVMVFPAWKCSVSGYSDLRAKH